MGSQLEMGERDVLLAVSSFSFDVATLQPGVRGVTPNPTADVVFTDLLALEWPESTDVEVLMLSMHSENNFVRTCLDAGARGYLLKSADLDLAEAIRQVAAGRPVFDRRLVESGVLGEMARPLSPRELEILRMIVQGKSHREIADELKIQVNTVRAHRANMMQAMGVHKAVQLALYAVARGLVKA